MTNSCSIGNIQRYDLNPKLLKLFKDDKLQLFFKEKLGDWRDGDRFWCEYCRRVEIYACYTDPMIRRFIHDHGNIVTRIPLTIDETNPKRGLLGMLNKDDLNLFIKLKSISTITVLKLLKKQIRKGELKNEKKYDVCSTVDDDSC